MKILVVGGAGYIGSHVVLDLLERKEEVTVYDNLSTGTEKNLFPEARFVKGDILDSGRLKKTLQAGFDAVFHFAALKAAGDSMTAIEKYCLNNISGTINLLNAACECGVPNFIFSSSAAIYGEPVYVPIDEKHPLEPVNVYGFTKLEIERLLPWYHRVKGLRYACLRYFNAAGFDTRGRITGLEKTVTNLLPVLMEVAAGMRPAVQVFGTDYPTRDGTGLRDYIHVTDLSDAHLKALDYIRANKQNLAVNLGSENGITVKEMLEAARRITGRPIPAEIVGRRPGDPAAVTASSAAAKQILSWEARHSDLETLVRTTWEAYKQYCR
ncbi:MAG: UDP-glucose 4-epimerase GalE [Desulfobacteraceae bacterium]|nr:MAG: UDP-glucose 4-epimerase GalE [Desulfobacteraceae bacterium]